MSDGVVTDITGSVSVVRFDRPAERNPLSSTVLDALKVILNSILPRPDIDAVIFTGTSDVFASGADIQELSKLDYHSAREFSKLGQDLFQIIADAQQLTIAAINGYCMGGGLDLALACDVRVASTDAVFAHPGARLGIITGWGGTQRLPRIIGKARALELFATAGRFDSKEALEMGLVSRVCDPVLDCAMRIAAAA